MKLQDKRPRKADCLIVCSRTPTLTTKKWNSRPSHEWSRQCYTANVSSPSTPMLSVSSVKLRLQYLSDIVLTLMCVISELSSRWYRPWRYWCGLLFRPSRLVWAWIMSSCGICSVLSPAFPRCYGAYLSIYCWVWLTRRSYPSQTHWYIRRSMARINYQHQVNNR